MMTALGVLGWAPDVFWRASLPEFQMAVMGLRRRLSGASALDETDIAALRTLMTGAREETRKD